MRTAGCPILLPGTLRCEKGKEYNRMGGERGGTKEEKRGKEFVNDLLRSDFHRRFMSKYVR